LRPVDALFAIVFSTAVFVAATRAFVDLVGPAAALAVEAFVVAVRAEAVRETELFSSTLFFPVTIFAAVGALVAFVVFVVFISFSSSVSFFPRPRRTGAFWTPDLRGDSGGVALVCARCARVRTIVRSFVLDSDILLKL
jgi:hypothetical protein